MGRVTPEPVKTKWKDATLEIVADRALVRVDTETPIGV